METVSKKTKLGYTLLNRLQSKMVFLRSQGLRRSYKDILRCECKIYDVVCTRDNEHAQVTLDVDEFVIARKGDRVTENSQTTATL